MKTIQCEACNGTGRVTESIPAHQEAGDIVDEVTREVICLSCDGAGCFPECPDHAGGHVFIKCDEWSATCTCGAVEGE